MWRFNFKANFNVRILVLLFVATFLVMCSVSYADMTVGYGYCKYPLNIRADKSIESRWIAQYPSQATIELVEDCGDWYKVEGGYIKKEYVFEEIDIYELIMFNNESTIYNGPNYSSGVYAPTNPGAEDYALKKKNGFVQLKSGGWILEEDISYLEYEPVYTYDYADENVQDAGTQVETNNIDIYGHYSTLSASDIYADNMINLQIRYIGTIKERTKAKCVTGNGSALYFKGDIPVYGIIDGYVYFPSGRRIYKLEESRFSGFQKVGADSVILDAYRTVYYSSSSGRKANIELVSSYLDGTVIKSGEVFSYNATTGSRSAAKGYQIAKVIVKGEYVDDYGGGVCQVSSTIYAAVMNDEHIKITSRKPHGLEVMYLPYDMDATVNYGSVDFKFKNKYPFDIILNVSSSDGVCLVTLTRVQ